MWAWASETRCAQSFSAVQRCTKASNAALASPYAPSPPKRPRLGEPGSTTCTRRPILWSAPCAARPATRRSTPQSRMRNSTSARGPASAAVPCTAGAANGKTSVGESCRAQLGLHAAGGLHHGGGDPLDERVDVGVRRQVGRQHPQGGTVRRVVAVEAAEERQALLVQPRGGRHDRGTAAEQVGHDSTGDRARSRPGHHSDVVGPLPVTLGPRDGAVVEGDQVGALLADGRGPATTWPGPPRRRRAPVKLRSRADSSPTQTRAKSSRDGGPAVVEQDRAVARRRTTRPCGPSQSRVRTRRAG